MKLVTNTIQVWRHYSSGCLLAVGAIQGINAVMLQLPNGAANYNELFAGIL